MPFEISAGVSIAPGNYVGMLERVEMGSGSYGTYRKWHWLVTVDGEVLPLSVMTSANTGPQSKSFKWLTALLGEAPQAGTTVEDPTGSRVLLTIGENEKGFPTVEAVGPYVEPQQTLPGIPR